MKNLRVEQAIAKPIVGDRGKTDLPRYYAMVPRVYIVEGESLQYLHGNGATPKEAVDDLAAKLRGKEVCLRAQYIDEFGEPYLVPDDFSWVYPDPE